MKFCFYTHVPGFAVVPKNTKNTRLLTFAEPSDRLKYYYRGSSQGNNKIGLEDVYYHR